MRLNLSAAGRRKNYRVHALVILAFEGPMPADKHEVAHWDGDVTNNQIKNLRYATCSENSHDKTRLGRMPLGETHPNSTISDEVAQRIRKDRLLGTSTIKQLAETHNVARSTIKRIIYSKGRFSRLSASDLTEPTE